MHRFYHFSLFSLLTFGLVGCAADFSSMGTAPAHTPLGSIRGVAFGGQQPISNAHVYVYAANTTNWAGPGIAASDDATTGNRSQSLLTAYSTGNYPTTKDASNEYYVTTDANGFFGLSGAYTCTQGQQVYLYISGGNSGAGTNSSIGLLAALGTCPAGGSMASVTPYVWVNEMTTVAAAYAFAGFATDAQHVGDDEGVSSNMTASLAKTGMANAFANAGNLVNVANAALYSTTPGSSGSNTGTVPTAVITTLANIAASCVNSNDSNQNNCNTLFANAKSGGSTGSTPTDTATAMINIAHNPAANIATLRGLVPANGAPFAGGLAADPNDFTLVVQFAASLKNPFGIGIDSSGNVWVSTSSAPLEVAALSPLGVPLSGSPYTSGATGYAHIAMDSLGNVWVGGAAGKNVISKFTSAGVGSTITGTSSQISGSYGITVDANDNIWFPSAGNSNLTRYSPSSATFFTTASKSSGAGVPSVDSSGNIWCPSGTTSAYLNKAVAASSYAVSSFTGSLSTPITTAVDANGSVWVANKVNVSKFANSGTFTASYSGGGASAPYGLALDGLGNVWSTNSGVIAELNNSGSALSPSTGWTGGVSAGTSVSDLVVDGSGNVWVAGNTANTVLQYIGVAVPVVAPISMGIHGGANKLGSRP